MPEPLEISWPEIMSLVRQHVQQQTFDTWFAPLKPAARANGTLRVLCPTRFFVDWFSEHHLGILEDAATRSLGNRVRCNLEVDPAREPDTDLFVPERGEAAPPPEPSAEEPVPAAGDRETGQRLHGGQTQLNPEYTFESFVVGSGTELAHAASVAVTRRVGSHFNPLFLHGGVGLGKTHLLHAVGNRILAQQPRTRVLYVTAEQFMTDLIVSIKQQKTYEFKGRYRTVDVLLVDDVAFLAGKESTQEEFFHTFNALYNDRRQIVLTSDRSPKEITTLEERLRSRFEWGLIVDVQPPDLETRIAILKKKTEVNGIEIGNDVVTFIAENITTNIRRLEGALIRLLAFASLTAREINLEMASEVLSSYFQLNAPGSVLVADVIREVASRFGVTVDQLKSKRRTQDLALARQVGMFVAREKTGASLNQIGRAFGNRDHSTVLHACKKIRKLMAEDPQFRGVVLDIMEKL